MSSSVNFSSGNLFHPITLLSIAGTGPKVDLTLSYNSLSPGIGSLGPGWTHSYALDLATGTAGSLLMTEEDGREIIFQETGPWIFTPLPRSGRAGTSIEKFTDGSYRMTRKDGTKYDFDSTGTLTQIQDRNGNSLTLGYSGGVLASMTDATGRVTTLGYDGQGRLASITDPAGRIFTLTHDGAGYLTGFTDPTGHTTTFTYNTNGWMYSKTDPEGNQTTYGYDADGRLTSATDAPGVPVLIAYQPSQSQVTVTGRNGGVTTTTYNAGLDVPLQVVGADNGVTTYAYDGYGNLLTETDPLGNSTTNTYDSSGNRTSVTDALDNTTTYTYNGFGQVTSITDPEGHVITNVYDNNGNLTSVTDPTGAATQYQYNTAGNVTAVIRPWGHQTDFTYDSYGNLLTATDPVGLTSTFSHDPVGNLTSRTDANGGTTTYAYDNATRLLNVTDALGAMTVFTYDGNGNRTTVTDANGHTTVIEYNERNKPTRKTDPEGHVTTYEYTFGGCSSCGATGGDLLESVTDPNGHVTSYEYDLFGRMTKETDPQGSQTLYTYDAVGNLLAKTDARGRVTTFAYDPLRRVTDQIDPLQGVTSFGYTPGGLTASVTDASGNLTTYAYDNTGRVATTVSPDTGTTAYTYFPDGTLATKTDANGTVVSYSYDTAERITQISFPTSSEDITFTYDSLSSSNGLGRLTNMADPSGTTTYHYDLLGRITQETKTVLGIAYTTGYAYDNVGNLTSIVYPSGRTVEFTYTSVDRPDQVQAIKDSVTQTLASSFVYDNVYNLQSVTLGNGTVQTQTFDLLNRTATIAVPGVTEYSFGYDAVGNIVSWTDNVSPAIPPNLGTTTYEYQANRLMSVTDGSSVSIYSYDQAGNPGTDGGRDFVYNQNQRLIRVSAGSTVLGEYTYDGQGRRVIKNASGVTIVYHYDQHGHLIEETDAAGNLLVDYVYLDGNPLAMIRKVGANEQTYYYHDDHLGTPRAMTDSAQAVVWQVAFDPFGNQTGVVVQTVENNLRFPGQYFDQETGLNYNMFRDYDPKTGRYIEPDPIGLAGGMNRYAYVSSNPLSLIDPLGLMQIEICRNKGTLTLYDDDGKAMYDNKVVTGCEGKNDTRLGSYKAGDWQQNKTNSEYSVPWNEAPWKNPYGPWFLPLYQNGRYTTYGIHGTRGWGWLPFVKPPIPGLDEYAYCSHGCVRLPNPGIGELHDLLPNPKGTGVVIKDCK